MSYYVYDDKKIFYSETGSGQPLLLLHGNTASSKMFEQIADNKKTDKERNPLIK